MMRSRRLLGWYVAGVVVPTLALLWLTFNAIEDQQEALAVIRDANHRLRAEQAESTRRIEQLRLIETCLRDPLWTALPSSYHQFNRQHRLARYLLLWRDGETIVPIHAYGPRTLPSDTHLAAAQDLELSGRDLPAALRAYQEIASTTKDARTHALALHRMARTLRKLGRHSESRAIWNRLENEFGDQTDLFGRPFGLLAAFAPTPADHSGILACFKQFQARRWPLSLEQQAFFLEQFAAVLGQSRVEGMTKRLREEEDLFAAIASIVASRARPGPLHARSRPVVLDGQTFEFWSLDVAEASGPELRGLIVDPDWVASNAVPIEPEPLVESPVSTGWFFGGLAALVAGLLVLAAALLARTSVREGRLAQEKFDSLAGLEHDVNRALTAISVKAQALCQSAGLSPDESDQASAVILGRVHWLNKCFSSTLKKAKAGLPPDSLRLILFRNSAHVFREAVRSFMDAYSCQGRGLSVEIPEALPSARLDPAAVERALVNLLENACKYSSQGSTIVLRAIALPSQILVEIQNVGEVIPLRDRRRIFEPFYRSTRPGIQDGFGIGLSVVRQVIEAHGGRINVQSAPTAGTTFRLFFPSEHHHGDNTDR